LSHEEIFFKKITYIREYLSRDVSKSFSAAGFDQKTDEQIIQELQNCLMAWEVPRDVIAGLMFTQYGNQVIDCGAVFKQLSGRVSKALQTYKIGTVEAFTSGLPTKEPFLLFDNEEAERFYCFFGRWVLLVLFNGGRFPDWLHSSVIKHIFSWESLEINDFKGLHDNLIQSESIHEIGDVAVFYEFNISAHGLRITSEHGCEPNSTEYIKHLKILLAKEIFVNCRLASLLEIKKGFCLGDRWPRDMARFAIKAEHIFLHCTHQVETVDEFLQQADPAFMANIVVLQEESPEELTVLTWLFFLSAIRTIADGDNGVENLRKFLRFVSGTTIIPLGTKWHINWLEGIPPLGCITSNACFSKLNISVQRYFTPAEGEGGLEGEALMLADVVEAINDNAAFNTA
jgi:hypothetical protein